jgi:hypothetical protein
MDHIWKRFREDRWGVGRQKDSRCGRFRVRANHDGTFVCLVKQGQQWRYYEESTPGKPVRHRKLSAAIRVFRSTNT